MADKAVKDVLLVGFGAVGAIYSLILQRSGLARVTVVARSNYKIVKDHGMNIQSQKYGDLKSWRPDRLFPTVSEALDRPYSYVLVATKAIPEITPTPKLLAPFLSPSYTHPQPTYVLMQNGLGIERDLYNALSTLPNAKAPRILSCAVWIGTNLLSDNVVEHNDFDRVSIGLYKPGNYSDTSQSPEEIQLLEDMGGMLEAGGSTVTLAPEIQRLKYTKNFWNLGFASFATLSRYTLPAIFQNPPVEELVVPVLREVFKETLAVGRAMGFDEAALPSSVIEDAIERTASIHRRSDSKHTPSMLLDVKNGRPMEIEVIVGEVVKKAKELNVDIPDRDNVCIVDDHPRAASAEMKGGFRFKSILTAKATYVCKTRDPFDR